MQTLAVLESDPEDLTSVVETAALRTGPGEETEEMFIRVTEQAVETPASSPDAELAAYCTLAAGRFDRLDVHAAPPVDAMFEIEPFLGWLSWVDADRVSVRLEGEVAVASALVLAAGDSEIRIECIDDRALLDGIETVLPERFAGDQYLDDSGDPMPTTIETTGATLSRLVEAVDLAGSPEGYPLVVRDGGLALDVEGEHTRVQAPLSSTVEGPAVTNRYDHAFGKVVANLDGPVTLQTGPGDPVAFVREGEDYTLRFVVAPV
jgi:hypothetical protein